VGREGTLLGVERIVFGFRGIRGWFDHGFTLGQKGNHYPIAATQFGVAAVRGFADRDPRIGIPEGIPRTVAMTRNHRHQNVVSFDGAIMP
jgi:hypothetical protein